MAKATPKTKNKQAAKQAAHQPKNAVKAKAEARTTSAPVANANRQWGRRLLGILLAVFAVIVAVNAVLIWLAVKSNTGVVSATAYEDGLAYNQTLAEQAQQAGLGWSVVRNGADFPARLVYELRDAQGLPLGSAYVRVKAVRPVGDEALEVEMVEFTDGTYAAEMAWPAPGVWLLEATFMHEGRSLTAHERVTVN